MKKIVVMAVFLIFSVGCAEVQIEPTFVPDANTPGAGLLSKNPQELAGILGTIDEEILHSLSKVEKSFTQAMLVLDVCAYEGFKFSDDDKTVIQDLIQAWSKVLSQYGITRQHFAQKLGLTDISINT